MPLDKQRRSRDTPWVRKTFPLVDPRHKPARVVESIKNNIRKYLKRERRKELPKGADYWDFDCRLGKTKDSAQSIHVSELVPSIDKAAQEAWSDLYVEILAKTGQRNPRADRGVSTEGESELKTEDQQPAQTETDSSTPVAQDS